MGKKLGTILAIMLITAVGGCVDIGTDKAETETEIRVRVGEIAPSILHAPQYLAINQDIFAREGLAVEIIAAQNAGELIAALREGRADIGLAEAEIIMQNYPAEPEDGLLSFSQLTQREGSFLLGAEPEAEFQWEDLKGKTVLMERSGGRQEMMLDYILKQHGLDPAEEVTVIADLDAAEVFLAGGGDYVILEEPSVSWLEKSQAGYPVASLGTAVGDIAGKVYFTSRSVLQERPDMIQKFSNAVYQAQRWMDRHSPDETARAIAPFFAGIAKDDLARGLGRCQQQNTWRTTAVMDEESFDLLQEILFVSGQLDGRVESSGFMDSYFARKAVVSSEKNHYR